MTQVQTGIELWLVDLARCGEVLDELERGAPRLADDERTRAEAFRDPVVRRERITAHTALRILLERAIGPGARRRPFVRGSGGAPQLVDGGASFSLSHTEGFALVGLAAVPPIGVDLERARPVEIPQRRREELCAAAVGIGGAPLPHGEEDRATVQAWVRLEAFTKARGRALLGTLTDLGLRGTGLPPPPPACVEAAARALVRRTGLTVSDVPLPAGLQGAAAVGLGARLPAAQALPADRAGLDELLGRPWPHPGRGYG